VVDSGLIGYSGRAGIYVPSYTQTIYNNLVGLGSARFNDYVADTYTFWRSFEIPEVLALFVSANDTSIINQTGLQLTGRFTPTWCNPWSPDGLGNNCLDVKAEEIFYEQGILQQMIVNLRLNFTVSFWGVAGLQTYVTEKQLRQELVVFKYWEPTKFLSSGLYDRIAFPLFTDTCHANNTNDINGRGGVSCDFPTSTLVKVSRAAVVDHSSQISEDFSRFFRLFELNSKDLMGLLNASSAEESSNDFYNLACDHLRTTTEWRTQVRNTYSEPRVYDWELPISHKYTLLASCVFGIVVCLISAVAVVINMRHPMVVAKNVLFSLLTLFGASLAILSSACLALEEMFPPSMVTCTTHIWVSTIGYVLALCAVGAKTYRIYRIFLEKEKGKIVSITDYDLLRGLGVLLGIIVVLLIIQTILFPASAIEIRTERSDGIEVFKACKVDRGFLYAALGYIGALLFGISKLAYDSRNAPTFYSEARELGLALYTLLTSAIVGAPLCHWFFQEKQFSAFILTLGIVMSLPVIIAVILLFHWRVLILVIRHSFSMDDSSHHGRRSMTMIRPNQPGRAYRRGTVSYQSAPQSRYNSPIPRHAAISASLKEKYKRGRRRATIGAIGATEAKYVSRGENKHFKPDSKTTPSPRAREHKLNTPQQSPRFSEPVHPNPEDSPNTPRKSPLPPLPPPPPHLSGQYRRRSTSRTASRSEMRALGFNTGTGSFTGSKADLGPSSIFTASLPTRARSKPPLSRSSMGSSLFTRSKTYIESVAGSSFSPIAQDTGVGGQKGNTPPPESHTHLKSTPTTRPTSKTSPNSNSTTTSASLLATTTSASLLAQGPSQSQLAPVSASMSSQRHGVRVRLTPVDEPSNKSKADVVKMSFLDMIALGERKETKKHS